MAGAEESPLDRFISDEAAGMGTDDLEGPDTGLLPHQVNGSQRNLGSHFPGVPAPASDHEVTGRAHREAVDRGHPAETVLIGAAAKGVQKEEKAGSQGNEQQAETNDAAHKFSKPLASSHDARIAGVIQPGRQRGQGYRNPLPKVGLKKIAI